MTVRGKEIANAFYRHGAQTAYFAGCSTGGQNALMEAQRFPEDYNGILAGAAAFNRTHLHMAGLSSWQNTHATPGRFILPGQMTLINNAVLAQCTGQDGGVPTDPFLTDPRDCKFDPKVLQCTGSNVPPACLSAEQVTTMRNDYAGTIYLSHADADPAFCTNAIIARSILGARDTSTVGGAGAATHISVQSAEAPSIYLLQNTYLGTNGTPTLLVTYPTNAPVKTY